MAERPVVGIPVPQKSWYAGYLYRCYICAAVTYGERDLDKHLSWHKEADRD